MRTNSIFFKIRLSFVLIVIFVVLLFVLIYLISTHKQEEELKQRALQAMRLTRHMQDDGEFLKDALKELELAQVSNEIYDKINSQSQNLFKTNAKERPPFIKRFSFENKNLVVIYGRKHTAVFEDTKNPLFTNMALFAILILVLTVLWLFYRSIVNNLKPLRELKIKAENLTTPNTGIKIDKILCDEIKAVNDALNKSAKRLSDVSSARSLFLRNIAHELKTPISKGMFLTQTIQNEETKDRLYVLFIHLNSLLNELLEVEKLSADGIVLNKKEYSLEDCLDEAVEKSFMDTDDIEISGEGAIVSVDFKLFTLCLKNLISNALKYSEDGKAKVAMSGKNISVSNIGEALPRPIEQLFEPFVKGNESSEGLGLGLYIAHQIAKAHGADITHLYAEKIHTFAITLK